MVHDAIELDTPKNSFYLPNNRKGYVLTDPKPRSSKTSIGTIIGIVIVSILVIYLVLLKSGMGMKILESTQAHLNNLYKQNTYLYLLFVLVIQFLLMILGLPCQTWICLLCTFTLKNIMFNFIFLTFCSFVSSLFIYFIGTRYLNDWLESQLRDNKFYSVLKIESKKSPWRTAFLTRLIYLPTGIKEYLLVIIKNPFPSFAVSSLIVHAIYIIELLMISNEIEELKDFFTKKKSWSNKSTFEKASFIFVFALIILTVSFMAYISYLTTKRVEEKGKIIKEQDSSTTVI